MWIFAAIGVVLAGWIARRSKPSRAMIEQQRRDAHHRAQLECELANAVRDAQRWFEMDLPKAAWESISDAFALLEVLRSRVERTEWVALQQQLLAAIPRALDAQPRSTPRPRRRLRRKSRGIYA